MQRWSPCLGAVHSKERPSSVDLGCRDRDDSYTNPVLGRLGIVLAACYSEVYPEALARLLEALATILDALATELQPRHVPFAEILARLTLVLRNPAEEVQAAAAYLVMVIARHAGRSIPDTAWLRVAHEMRDTLGAQRRRVRYRAVEAYGWVARVLGRMETLVGPLLSVLQQSDRSMRIAAAVALAIAAAQDLGGVLPLLLLDAYVTEEDKHVQTGVIKAIGFLCSFSGAMKRVWDPVQVYAVTRLLESVLVERYETHRQVACETVGHFALALVDQGYEEALVHLLDHVWPNYIALGAEVSDSHLTHAVEFAVRALGGSVGGRRASPVPGPGFVSSRQGGAWPLLASATLAQSLFWRPKRQLELSFCFGRARMPRSLFVRQPGGYKTTTSIRWCLGRGRLTAVDESRV
ncbi:Splicing factor 3B subunit 1 [Cyanidiococcus yangmingshanensis]|uniref:Splicing factor 3B subunit 1 n=1 Tax=Cyanidiococcus yangmingshanensis TaxID=2690220 RepID=A0A7J7IE50_9RHOD|nr:Splicing factor 3B subunit 1 [Cyanidiococcus yangmingshanensis]